MFSATNDASRTYNAAHIRTRIRIEQAFGILKRRFPALHFGIRTKIDTVYAIIVACAVLHNIAIDQNEPEPPNDVLVADPVPVDVPVRQNQRGAYVRQALIATHFTR